MTLILPRRRFLAGLVGLVAAPAVVKASSLMKIVVPRPSFAVVDFSDVYGRSPMMDALPDMVRWQYEGRMSLPLTVWRKINQDFDLA